MDQLGQKCIKFLEKKRYRSFGLSGGVANNENLRERLGKICQKRNVIFLAAEKKHSGDNAAMIAHAAHLDPDGLWSNVRGGLNFNPGLTLDAVPI
jgi:N6-L-threonylcarbamoyladenine synthase